ncbi:hypothetical protein SUDANB121_05800 [Nocardiopsis dassonvillei]
MGRSPRLEASGGSAEGSARGNRRRYRADRGLKGVPCRSCGVVAHADRNASRVLVRRGQDAGNAGRGAAGRHPLPGDP